jgi:hypothetical protein
MIHFYLVIISWYVYFITGLILDIILGIAQKNKDHIV